MVVLSLRHLVARQTSQVTDLSDPNKGDKDTNTQSGLCRQRWP
jgi:hypothetical protein